MQRIQLENTDFEGLNNVYVLQHDGGTALIDSGIHSDEMYDQLVAGLETAGTTVAEINHVFLTHWHRDHAGLASEFAHKNGATIHAHTDDAPLVRDPPWQQMEAIYRRLFDEWGIPEEKRAPLEGRFEGEDDARKQSVEVEPFEDGDTFEVGDHVLEVVHAPGHTAGLSCFAFDGESGRECFAGDALLPEYTPNIGGADLRVDRPLQQYLDTLVRLVEGDFIRAWPGHRDVIEDPTARAKEIVDHHRSRAEKILGILDEEPKDAWTVSARLFGELNGIHILHGPGEAYAHLDHLTRHGIIESTSDGYVLDEETEGSAQAVFPTFDDTPTE